MFLKASFGSYYTLTAQHHMRFSSSARARCRDISTAAPLRSCVGYVQTAILNVFHT